MTKKLLLVSLLAAFVLGPQYTKAQGCTDSGPVTLSCNTKSCFGDYSAPSGCPDGSTFSCTVVMLKCCNHEVPVFVGEACGDAVTRNPIARKTFDLLSDEGIQVAILGCSHHFVLYRPSAEASDSGKDLIFTRKSLLPTGF